MHRSITVCLLLLALTLAASGCGKPPAPLVQCTLFIEVQGQGTVTPPSGTKFDRGTIVELVPTPDSGWVFKEWAGTDKSQVLPDPWRIAMDGDTHLTAVFEQLPFALNITVTGQGRVDQQLTGEDTVALTAVPQAGWIFVRWEGDAAGSGTTVEVVLDSAKSVTAVFVQLPFELTVSTVGEGKVERSIDSATNFLILTAVPKEGWVFVRWEGDGGFTATEAQLPIPMDCEHGLSYTAVFEPAVTVPPDRKPTKQTEYYMDDTISKVKTWQYNTDGTVAREDTADALGHTTESIVYTYSEGQVKREYYSSTDLTYWEVDLYSEGKVTSMNAYDASGKLVGTATYAYSAGGTVITFCDAQGTVMQTITREYSSGRLTKETTEYPDGSGTVVQWEFRTDGLPSKMTTNSLDGMSTGEYMTFEYLQNGTEKRVRYMAADPSSGAEDSPMSYFIIEF